MQIVDLMVFDLDGTLVDSGPDLIRAVNFTRRALELPELEAKEIISFVGDGLDKLAERFVGPELQHRLGEATAIFKVYYAEHCVDETVLYPGVKEVLTFFRDKKKVIITNKLFDFTRKITDYFELTNCFDSIIGLGSTAYHKPEAMVLLPLLEEFRIAPHRSVVIGDGVADINLARNAGVKSCALLNGFTSREVLLSFRPDFACESLWELKNMFC